MTEPTPTPWATQRRPAVVGSKTQSLDDQFDVDPEAVIHGASGDDDPAVTTETVGVPLFAGLETRLSRLP